MTGWAGLLRIRGTQDSSRVTYIELFFDLVFVFAVTQLSHSLLRDLSLFGALRTAFLLMAVWWVWIFTSWCTNWLNPETAPVRLLLLVLMLAGLVLSTALPEAFGSMGAVFAGAYVFMQVGRSLFMLAALARREPGNFRNFLRITAWLTLSGVFWIAGALLPSETRPICWVVALTIEYLGPAAAFWTPGLGSSKTGEWAIEGHHLAERCALFVIIALGESVLMTGVTFAEIEKSHVVLLAAVVAFASSVTLWWIYFDAEMEQGSLNISRSADPGRLARIAYTYVHLPIIAGIIAEAVADELMLTHPDEACDWASAAVILGAPALYLAGNALFKWSIGEALPRSHLIGLVFIAILLNFNASILVTATGAMLVLVAVALRSTRTARRAHR
ncbi:MAG TPA: low temperature requirement protein A [Dongiaceae bacterium]|nr:low temperature requirement protein A [Dongiaceae bacterium]